MPDQGEDEGRPVVTSLRRMVPWWAKIAAKLIVSRLPVPYRFWKRMGLFEHGAMQDPAYSLKVFQGLFDAVQPEPGFSCLELGPGDSLATAMIAKAHGAREVWMVDSGPFASTDAEAYRRMARYLGERRLAALESFPSVGVMLEQCNARYLTAGVASLDSIPSGSVDFIFSQAVLEHVRKRDVEQMFSQLRRIISPSGAMAHQIDFKDHLSQALNSLRFSEQVWEAEWMASSGFYTNRIRRSEMMAIAERAGFASTIVSETRWDTLPTPRRSMSPAFSSLPFEDLAVSGCLLRSVPVSAQGTGTMSR